MRTAYSCCLILLLTCGCSPLYQRTGRRVLPLDGTTWQVNVTPDTASAKDGEKSFNDTLIFDDGKVVMTECLKYGFGASAYTTSQAGEKWSFKTEQKSPEKGNSQWSGEITGESIRGDMSWTKKDGESFHYAFEGKKVEG